jgi:uncharacterized protein YjbI with pentapeptide repeats
VSKACRFIDGLLSGGQGCGFVVLSLLALWRIVRGEWGGIIESDACRPTIANCEEFRCPCPKKLADLPYAGYLERFEGELSRGGEYAEVHFRDAEFDDCEAANGRVTESAFTGVAFTKGTFGRTRLSDVWLSRTRWVGTNLGETQWLDAAFLDSFLAAVAAYGATLRRVTFQECKVDTLNLRSAMVQDVVFDRCDLGDVDFGEATLTNVTFPGSRLRRARFVKATLKQVDFRGAAELDVAGDCAPLRGAVIDSGQLAELAPALAHTLGIVVKDR